MAFFRASRLFPRLSSSWGLRRASGSGVSLRRCVVEKADKCVVIELVSENKENRLDPEFLGEFNRALDQAESYEDATCMVTISEGKHYSLGLELDLVTRSSGAQLAQYMFDVQKLYCRLLTFPLVTVAAANGHIYAAGVLMGLSHDYIVMNSSKGFFCLPEVNLRLNFPAGWVELAKARLPQREHKAVVVLGKRYTGIEAEAAGIVDEVCPPAQLRDTAIAAAGRLAGSEGLDRKTLSTMKRDLYRDVVLALSEPPRYYSPIPLFT